jgi:hypothetical protein
MQRRSESELLERLDLVRDQAERRTERLPLEESVDAEARDAGNRVGEVELAVELEPLLLLTRENAVQQVACVLRAHGRHAVEALEMTAQPDDGRRPHGQVEVGRLELHHLREQLVDRGHFAHVAAIGSAAA